MSESLVKTEALTCDLATALSAAMGDVEAIKKDGKNTMQGYSFTSEAAIANTLRPIMSKHGLALVPTNIRVVNADTVQTKNATMQRVAIEATYTLMHKGGQNLSITVPGEGMDSLDKAIPKALTMAYKYAMIQVFCVGRGDDPDDGKGYEGHPRYDARDSSTAGGQPQEATSGPTPRATEATSRQWPARGVPSPTAPPGAPVWRGKLVDMATKTGKKSNGTEWTLYTFTGGDGAKFGTFSDTIAAGLLKLDKHFIEIVFSTTAKGNDTIEEYRDVSASEVPL